MFEESGEVEARLTQMRGIVSETRYCAFCHRKRGETTVETTISSWELQGHHRMNGVGVIPLRWGGSENRFLIC
jgi:hypothetical protein